MNNTTALVALNTRNNISHTFTANGFTLIIFDNTLVLSQNAFFSCVHLINDNNEVVVDSIDIETTEADYLFGYWCSLMSAVGFNPTADDEKSFLG